MQIIPEAFSLISIASLTRRTQGKSVIVGIIDGPVDTVHPGFAQTDFRNEHGIACSVSGSRACQHGTFVAGILASSDETTPGICPAATLAAKPVFCEADDIAQCPVVTIEHLAESVREMMKQDAKIINLSLGLAPSGIRPGQQEALTRVFEEAFRKGVIIVGASGNHGRIGHNPLFSHPWVIPVVACDQKGRPLDSSNLGSSIGQRGIMAPGWKMKGLQSGGGYTYLSGTSVAAPFLSGTIALLWSLYPGAKAHEVQRAVTGGKTNRSVVPMLLNAELSETRLRALVMRK